MGRNSAAWGDGRERDTEYVEGGEWMDGRMGEGEVDELRRRRGPARLRKRRGAGNGWIFLIPLGSRVGSDKRRYQQLGGGDSDTVQTHNTWITRYKTRYKTV